MARRNNDPFASFRFKLEIDSIQVAGFSEVTGLNMETKVMEYKEGGNNATTLKFPEATTFGNVTLKRGVSQSNDLFDWQRDVATGQFKKNPRANSPNVAIVLMDEAGTSEVKRWNLVRALPVKWVGPDLKANASETGIEALELAHEGIQRSQG
jgi:phage tail-like protein